MGVVTSYIHRRQDDLHLWPPTREAAVDDNLSPHQSESLLSEGRLAGRKNASEIEAHQVDGSTKELFTTASTTTASSGSFLRWWYFEILSCGFATICLIAQVVVLSLYDGKLQDSWTAQSLTLNGLIAILATFCRSALMVPIAACLAQSKWNAMSGRNGDYRLEDVAAFEAASRGMGGSLQVLARFKGTHIACLGGILTIATLGIGISAQQLVTVRIDNVPDLEASGVPAPGPVFPRTAIAYGSGRSTGLPFSTDLALSVGFLSDHVNFLEVVCPTGNCTWPIIPTIGICGACDNATSRVKVLDRDPSSCGVVLSEGANFGFRPCDDIDIDDVEDELEYKYFTMQTLTSTGETDGVPFPGGPREDRLIFGEFAVIGTFLNESDWANHPIPKDPQAYHCGLWYCVEAHQARVDAGILREEVVGAWSEARFDFDSDRGTFQNLPDSLSADPDEEFTVIEPFTIWDLNGNATIARYKAGSSFYDERTTRGQALHEAFGNMDSFIAKVARSLSNDIRATSTPNSMRGAWYQGTSYINQISIVVRWPWITFQVVVVLLSFFYLVAEMIRTARMPDVRPRKDDALVPLWIELDKDVREQAAQGLGEPDGIRRRIGKDSVQLLNGGKRMRVSAAIG
ncbi:hypothetical protein GCG54_00000429 [Colletotrichum gloeosporioides]|uniref:Uncharacterized protein n=1 Tax=Colletotrichum gloeosporioides TaxID=474922 RepID=A0A8H4CUM6_COLGL|nr:uncharacterized protein GCG54_00000429 [Colletotrichum gloeosporioides]KAF3810383.1 hypothetical protein GCG54_00000429 [Colletotrichum gloeosporioides]